MLNKKALSGTVAAVPGWDLEDATWPGTITWYDWGESDSVNFYPKGLFFKPDGLKMYIVGGFTPNAIYEFDLTTAWDVTTASYLQKEDIGAAGRETRPNGLFFKPDGTKFYIVGHTDDVVEEYDLSTAWDITTSTYNQNFSVATEEGLPGALFFKPDGTKMYVSGILGDDIIQYDLTTAWDISTASYTQNFSVASQTGGPQGLFFKSDGTTMFVCGSNTSSVITVFEYGLTTAWDISTASLSDSENVARDGSGPSRGGLSFKADGTKFFIASDVFDRVVQYDLSTAWDVTTASPDTPTNYFQVYAEANAPQGLFFKTDGAKMYVIDGTGDDINEYNLSTAWDITTASYNQNFSIAAKETTPGGLFFKPDGLKLYIVGSSSDSVHQYNLTTAWDISTASFNQSFSVSTEETNPQDLFFKDDGTKMYVCGWSGDDINEYDLSVAWDISTASYLQNFNVYSQVTSIYGLFFKPDGKKVWAADAGNDNIVQYSLGTAWDISSASYDKNFSVSTQDTTPTSVAFKDDGTKMYMVGTSYRAIWSYDLV